MSQNTKTPVMVLQELTIKNDYPLPDYTIVFQKSGTHENRFDFMVNVANIQATGSGSSKKIGKHQAAHNALMKLKEIGLYDPLENPVAAFKVPLRDENSTYISALNCIVDLQTICIENKLPAPEFIEISSVGPPHNKEFTYECKISSITTESKASTKKMAKQIAAREMLERIKEVLPTLIFEEKDLHKTLTDMDTDALIKFQDIVEIIPDKTIRIDEIPNTLAKLMSFKDLKYEDFEEELKLPSEETLTNILDKLEVKYNLEMFQDQPPIAILKLKIDTPFTMLGLGKTPAEAKRNALEQTFTVMNEFMQIQV